MYLDVGGGHRLYYEVHGAPTGKPAVVLHGGPGGGMQRQVLDLFDLKRWRVLLFDQHALNAALAEINRERQADRSGTDDKNVSLIHDFCDLMKVRERFLSTLH